MSEAEAPEERRLARNLNELPQELRVAQRVRRSVRILLPIAFSGRYAWADAYVRGTHLVTVLVRRGRREHVIELANRFAVRVGVPAARRSCDRWRERGQKPAE
ncbi:DUF6328 family protein [Saccharothrix espanaensis]|uniref:DUF6328 family protein n=1 Tax=Saccharothrix espanaensis TaxID=103731 RepID=UPI0038B4EA28